MKTHIVKGLCVIAVFAGLITVPTSATLNTLDDTVPPELIELSFNPASVDVSTTSQTVTATLRMTDELSGVSSACMFLFSPSQRQFRRVCGVPISGDAHDRVDQISIEFPQLSESGSWRVADLTISDVVGNRRTLNESDLISRGLPAHVQVTVNNPPVAICQTVIKSADNSCGAIVTPEDVNNGSFDVDGDSLTLSLNPLGPYLLGTTNTILTVTDSKGAVSQCTAAITVVDNTPPVISCPSSIELIAPLTENSVIVNYPAATTSDNCPLPRISCSPSSGSRFTVGATNVVCTATDVSNNSGSCGFTVTVLTPQAATQAITTNVNDLVTQGFLTQGEGDSLRFKLQAAITQLDQGNTRAAVSQFNAFINQVNGLINGGSLTTEQGGTLIQAVNEIMNHV